MTDVPVECLDVVAHDVPSAAQARVPAGRHRARRAGLDQRSLAGIRRRSPPVRTSPVVGITVVLGVLLLVLAVDWPVDVDRRAVLHLRLAQGHRYLVVSGGGPERARRNDDLPS